MGFLKVGLTNTDQHKGIEYLGILYVLGHQGPIQQWAHVFPGLPFADDTYRSP